MNEHEEHQDHGDGCVFAVVLVLLVAVWSTAARKGTPEAVCASGALLLLLLGRRAVL